MKSLAHQDLAELGGGGSVLARQKSDHVELDQLLHRLVASRGAEQDAILLKLYRLVFRHAYAEETVLWPVIRRVLPDGHALTLRVEIEHQQISELVTRLEAVPHGSAERSELLSRLVALLREDVRDEEDLLLPRLQARLTPGQLRRLGIAWEAVRRTAPTRAHAIVSRRPPGNLVAALPLTLLDHGRDAVDALLHRGAGPAAPPLRAVSAGLRRASHAVERLPGLKRGEDAATRIGGAPRSGWRTAAIVSVVAASTALALARSRRSKQRRKGAGGAASATGEVVPGVRLDAVFAPAQPVAAAPRGSVGRILGE